MNKPHLFSKIRRRDFLSLASAAAVTGCKADIDSAGDSAEFWARSGPSSAATVEVMPSSSERHSPWGIATSHSRSFDLGWLGDMGRIGMTWLRGFDVENADESLEAARAAGFAVSGILQMGSSFPVEDLDAWEAHVAGLVRVAAGRVRHWEVWNEPPNFSESKSPEHYAALVIRAYDAVKAIDPDAQVAICSASVRLRFMERAILAGAKDHFDYVTLHPYETLSLVSEGFEPLFLSIVPTLRKMLAASNPSRTNVPVVFSELGLPVEGEVTSALQADIFIKAYVLSLAQGVTRTHWFEGVDGDSGPYGLIAADGTRRISYAVAARTISLLGNSPRFLGRIDLHGSPRAFVFQGAEEPVLIAWGPSEANLDLDFLAEVRLIDPRTGESSVGSVLALQPAPTIAIGLPAALVERARADRDRPTPWGGSFVDAREVIFEAPEGERGLHPLSKAASMTIDGSEVRDQSGASAHRFAVDPNFVSYDTVALQVVAEVRRTGEASAGFNLKYESTTGERTAGSWVSVPQDGGWHVLSWNIDDARFVGKWGYHVSLDSDTTDNSQYALRRVTVRKR